jgi:hypothetical protein
VSQKEMEKIENFKERKRGKKSKTRTENKNKGDER